MLFADDHLVAMPAIGSHLRQVHAAAADTVGAPLKGGGEDAPGGGRVIALKTA